MTIALVRPANERVTRLVSILQTIHAEIIGYDPEIKSLPPVHGPGRTWALQVDFGSKMTPDELVVAMLAKYGEAIICPQNPLRLGPLHRTALWIDEDGDPQVIYWAREVQG